MKSDDNCGQIATEVPRPCGGISGQLLLGETPRSDPADLVVVVIELAV